MSLCHSLLRAGFRVPPSGPLLRACRAAARRRLLPERRLLDADAELLAGRPVVYVLISRSMPEVGYVGSSSDILTRLPGHASGGTSMTGRGTPAFPFTLYCVAVGYATIAQAEEAELRLQGDKSCFIGSLDLVMADLDRMFRRRDPVIAVHFAVTDYRV